MTMEWVDLQIRINRCGSVRCEPNWNWDSAPMPDYDVWYVWAGQGQLSTKGQTWPASVGNWFCLQPGETCQGQHDPKQRLGVTYLHFDFVDDRGRVQRLPPAKRPPLQVTMREVEWVEQALKRAVALHESGNAAAQAEARMLLRSVLLLAARRAAEPPARRQQREHHDAIWSVARYIGENPGEIFSIDALADRAGFSADHFARLFRQFVGLPPKEFCIRTRLRRAQSLLSESHLSVEQIAQALGYADVFFFSRQFKQRLGVPPTTWRTRAQST